MARPKSPDGKSTLLAFRISQRQKAAYDAARGDLEIAEWARRILDRAAGVSLTVIADARVPPGAAMLTSPGAEPVVITGLSPELSRPARKRKAPVPQAAFSDPPVNPLAPPETDCPHPKARRDAKNKDLCRACGQIVG